METNVYATRMGIKESPVCSLVNSVKRIVYDSPLVQRIIFDKGEIELKVSETELSIYSKSYSSNGETKITKQIVKQLRKGYDPESALTRAKIDILQRVANLELKTRDEETARCMRLRLKLMYSYSKKQNSEENNMENFIKNNGDRLENAVGFR